MDDERIGVGYTGHPFFDIGLATLTAFAEKTNPRDLTAIDLEAAAKYIEDNYTRPPLKGAFTMAFTSNAWFVQDAYNPDRPELTADQRTARLALRELWGDRHLRQWYADNSASSEHCIFTGLPAIAVVLSNSLPEGRAGRAQIPLLQGDDSINFFTNGVSGIPVSGIALLALQFFPLGCAKAGIGLLGVHSEDDDLTFRFARRFKGQNDKNLALTQASGETKLPGSVRSLKTLLVSTLLEVEEERRLQQKGTVPASVTAYNFNNGKSADLQLYELPMQVVDFLRVANSSTYREAWVEIIRRGWQTARASGRGDKQQSEFPKEPRYNTLYEDIFTLPEQAPRFVRTYFLRIPRRTRLEGDPRAAYSLRRDITLVSWPLVSLFLERIKGMEQKRIEAIRDFGDKLAYYTRQRGGSRFFRTMLTENNSNYLRGRLVKANWDSIKAGEPQLFDMDGYIEVFEEGEEVYRADWRLARDLVLMRMIDQLKDWLTQHPDALPDTQSDEEEEEGDGSGK